MLNSLRRPDASLPQSGLSILIGIITSLGEALINRKKGDGMPAPTPGIGLKGGIRNMSKQGI